MNDIGVALSPLASRFGPLLFAGDLHTGMKEAAAAGCDGVEISVRDSSTLDQEAIAGMADMYKLSVFALATGQSFVSDGFSLFNSNASMRDSAVKRLLHHIDFAERLGSKVILGGILGKIEFENPSVKDIRRTGIESLTEVAQYATKKDVVLLLEAINRYEVNIVNTAENGLELIEAIGLDNVRLLLDAYHMNIEESSIEGAISLAGDRLGYFHLADSNRMYPGAGHTDFRQIFECLDRIGYKGPMVAEVLPLPDSVTALHSSVEYMRRNNGAD